MPRLGPMGRAEARAEREARSGGRSGAPRAQPRHQVFSIYFIFAFHEYHRSFNFFCQHFREYHQKLKKIINEYQVQKIKKDEWFTMKSNIGDILDNLNYLIQHYSETKCIFANCYLIFSDIYPLISGILVCNISQII